VRDADDQQHVVLGMIDHGSRVSLALRPLRRFNAWALLGCLFLAIGQFGRPKAVRCDNHPVFRAKPVRRVLRWAGIRMQFSEPGKPWQNGRIERFFGTFKSHLCDYVMRDSKHLMRSLADFRFWYNTVRPHRHLDGATPAEAWHGIDPYRHAPKEIAWFETWEGRLNGWVLRQ
jgi:transposase InsO family protein